MAKSRSTKQTKSFLKSGALAGQIEARHKRKAFEQKKKGRDARRNKGVLPKHQQGKSREEESDEEFEEVKKRGEKRKVEEKEEEEEEEELDVDGLLGGQGIEEDGEEDEVRRGFSLSLVISSPDPIHGEVED